MVVINPNRSGLNSIGYSVSTSNIHREYGARPLKRIIQQKVEDALSDALLSGDIADGDADTVQRTNLIAR